ncbi:PapB/FocB family fimbrial expression transcriptional regulator [Citrobacter braakii]|uniref:PapB/FocB family fimbrial expression transcriptional regulator n=1 Tax=Citrobacter braakii TaxID=57706 RepID=UPI003C2DA81D|nr:transcriptional regulator [Citrobacter freundii]
MGNIEPAGDGDKHVFFIPGEMVPGRVNIKYLRLLLLICNVNNPRVCKAMEDVLVYGKSRKQACLDNGITQGYFSMKYQKLQFISQTIMKMYEYITP